MADLEHLVESQESTILSWQGMDHGREGLLRGETWAGVLRVLAAHEGSDIRETQSDLYKDLTLYHGETSWTGKEGNRSLFRDYQKPWTRLGVMRPTDETDHKVELTDTGRRIVGGELELPDFFRDFIDHFVEEWSSETHSWVATPFRYVAVGLGPHTSMSTNELLRRAEVAAIADAPPQVALAFSGTDVSRRRFRSYLRVLENAGALSDSNGEVTVLDTGYTSDLALGGLTPLELPGTAVPREELEGLEQDRRSTAMRESVIREGQGEFRRAVLAAYSGRCCVTGVSEAAALDAAHILPYLGRHSNSVGNGLLLRSDLHKLLDKGLLAIDPESGKVVISDLVSEPEYLALRDQTISIPAEAATRPDPRCLQATIDRLKVPDG